MSLDANPAVAEGTLRKGSLGWINVAALGAAIAISGNFSGWNTLFYQGCQLTHNTDHFLTWTLVLPKNRLRGWYIKVDPCR